MEVIVLLCIISIASLLSYCIGYANGRQPVYQHWRFMDSISSRHHREAQELHELTEEALDAAD